MATAIEPRAETGIVALLDSDAARKIIEPLCPAGTDYRRVIQEVYLAVKDNPDLLKCEPASIVRAVGRAVSWGLVIGETVHLVPFGKQCKAMQDYKGKIELVERSGAARAVHAENVYEHDDFLLELGAHPIVRLRPVLDPTKRGAFIGTYAVALLSHDNIKAIWVPASEIEAIRQKHSKQWKSGVMPYWYGQKTAIHRLAKQIPKSAKTARALATLDEDEDDSEGGALPTESLTAIGAPPAMPSSHQTKPITTTGADGYDDAPKALNAAPVAAKPLSDAVHAEARRAAAIPNPYEDGEEPNFDNMPFPEGL
jgi:phage RecT family recombinase